MDYGKASIVFRLDSTYKNKKFVMYSDTVVIKTIDEPIKEPIVEIVKDINSIDAIQDKIENQSNIMITIFIILSVICVLTFITCCIDLLLTFITFLLTFITFVYLVL